MWLKRLKNQGVYLSTQAWNVRSALLDSLLKISHHTHYTEAMRTNIYARIWHRCFQDRTPWTTDASNHSKPTHLQISWRRRHVDHLSLIVKRFYFYFYCCYAKSFQPSSARKVKICKVLKNIVKVILGSWPAWHSVIKE